MVSWQQFVSLCFDVKRERGNDVESLEESQEVLQVASSLWNDRKDDLRTASQQAAKSYIERNA